MTTLPGAGRLRRAGRGGAVFLAGTLVSLALLGPHVWPLDGVVEAGGDHGLMTWNLWVVNESLKARRSPLFTPLVYHPLGASLARHTLVPGFWPVTLAADAATGDDPLYPVYAYRLSILVSFALGSSLSYRLLRRLGAPPLAALVPALQFAFCCFFRLHVPHLNHVSMAFLLPATTLAALRLYERPGAGRAAALGAALGGGVYFSELTAFVYLGLPVAVLLAALSGAERPRLARRIRALGLPGAAALAGSFVLVLAPFAWSWAGDAGISPQPRQAWNWSANLAGFVVPNPDATPLYGGVFATASARLTGIGGHETFLGFPLLLAALVGATARPPAWARAVAGLAVVFLVLSLGPSLKLGAAATEVPLPYALLMKVPPFDAGRTPVRCVVLAVFCLALLGARGLTVAAAALPRGKPAAVAAGLALAAWAFLEVRQPAPVAPGYTVPGPLADLVPGPVVNVPPSFMDGAAVFLQVLHGRPILTGFVSRRTPEQVAHVRELARLLRDDPPAFLRHVQALGVRNVVLGPGTPDAAAAALLAGPLRVVDLRGIPLRTVP